MYYHTLEPLDYFSEYIKYDPQSGTMTWLKRVNSKVPAGREVGRLDKHGHRRFTLKGKTYMAHRIAYYFITGEDPGDMQVDHIDLDKSNNAWDNLRLATPTQNNANATVRSHNQVGLKGVGKDGKKFRARITYQGNEIHLGTFDTAELAHAAYIKKAEELYGQYHRAF